MTIDTSYYGIRTEGTPYPKPSELGTHRHRVRYVLDHGFIRLIERYGHGEALEGGAGIIEAARQSTQGSFRGWDRDMRLLRHLFHSDPPHATPFEFAGMVIEVRAPLFVFREWIRHRTQSYNEMSARYAPVPNLNYVPTIERLMMGRQATSNKQAGTTRDAVQITEEAAARFRVQLEQSYMEFEERYQSALRAGVPKELARCGMPVGRYSQMRASANLRNWMAFLTLRMDPAAQWEIRQYANALGEILSEAFPQIWCLFEEKANRRQKAKALLRQSRAQQLTTNDTSQED